MNYKTCGNPGRVVVSHFEVLYMYQWIPVKERAHLHFVNASAELLHTMYMYVPSFVLQFAFSIIHGSRRAAKNGEGLGTRMTSRWTQGCRVS